MFTEVYLEYGPTSTMKLFCDEKVRYFRKNAAS